MRRSLLALMLLATPAAAQVPAGGGPSDAAPDRPRSAAIDFEQKLGAQVPLDLPFRDEGDRRVTLRDCLVPGKPAVLVLAYYRCPMLCSKVLNGLLDVMRKTPYSAGTDYTVLAVSFDPKEHGSQATRIKDTYVTGYGRPEGDRGWRFLTGDRTAIDQLTAAVGFKYEYDKVFKEYNHPSGIMVMTPDGRLSRYMYGIDFEDPADPADPRAARAATTFRLALVEAGEGRVGSLADKLILSCFRFDHLEQRYSLNYLLAVRAGGVLTVLALAGAVVYFRVRERRAARAVAQTAGAGSPAGGVA
ncbi:MAG: SCO family protein [Gemmataceae bacterium]|nr:SCO family protein [Gemmataceae bacterium]